MVIHIHDMTLPELLMMPTVVFDEIETAGCLCFSRAPRFVGGYDVKDHLTKLYKEFFGNTNTLQRTGLNVQYKALKERVSEEKLMGLILCGINIKNIIIDTYPRYDNKVIELSVESISKCLVYNYFTKQEVDHLCRSQSNFHIYYSD